MSSAIDDICGWWHEARPRVDAAIAAGESGPLPDEFTRHVQAIDPGLE